MQEEWHHIVQMQQPHCQKLYIAQSERYLQSALTEIQQTPDTSVHLEKILVTQPKNSSPPSPSTYNVINMSYEPAVETKLTFQSSIN